MPAERWSQLVRDPTLVRVLERAGARADATRPRDRGAWGVRFARAWCAEFGERVHQDRAFRGLEVVPRADRAGEEPLAVLGGHQRRRLGVIAGTLATGPRLVVSLKSEHFPSRLGHDGRGVPARLHELHDEARAVHATTPGAVFVGVVFLPLAATEAKSGPSAFARTVPRLRALTGRDDPAALSQYGRLDWSVVALYEGDGDGPVPSGVVRYFDASQSPPRRGRPRVDTTMGPGELLWRMAELTQQDDQVIVYADPESDDDE